MVKYREWLDKNYPNHSNRNIPNIKKVVADESFEDLADFSMFIDLEELELVSAPDIFMGSGTNTKLKMLKIKNTSSFSFFNIRGSLGSGLCGKMDLSNLRGLKKLEITDESDLQEKAKEARWLSYYPCYDILTWSKRELELKIASLSSTPRIIKVVQTKEGQIAELRGDLDKEKEKNNILEKQLDERISPEELVELLQTQMDLQMNLEEKERENRLLREQLEEILQRGEQERLLARIEFPPQ